MRSRIPILAALAGLALGACTTTGSRHAAADGAWRQHGYGRLLRIDGDSVRVYDHNAVECHSSAEARLADMGEVVDVDDRALSIRYGINVYRFERLAALPARCRDAVVGSSPLENFDSLWHTFDEHYAFFEQRGVDWDALRAKYRPRIRDGMGDVELYRALGAMLAELGDGHVELEAPDAVRAALRPAGTGPASPKPDLFGLGQQAQQAILQRYVRAPHAYNAGAVRWGLTDAGVGYVQVNHMLMLADYGIDQSLGMREFFEAYFETASDRAYQTRDEVLGARRLVARIVRDLADAPAVILDLRFNGGGKDGAALEFLRPFVQAPVLAFGKKAREGNGFGPASPVLLQPGDTRHPGRLFVLTSTRTASAAEVLVLASRQVPGSLRIGAPTEGIFSDTLDKTLPNGWQYTLSNEVYESPRGEVFEGVGIPPDIRMGYPRDAAELYRRLRDDAAPSGGGDATIDAVLRIVEERWPPQRAAAPVPRETAACAQGRAGAS